MVINRECVRQDKTELVFHRRLREKLLLLVLYNGFLNSVGIYVGLLIDTGPVLALIETFAPAVISMMPGIIEISAPGRPTSTPIGLSEIFFSSLVSIVIRGGRSLSVIFP